MVKSGHELHLTLCRRVRNKCGELGNGFSNFGLSKEVADLMKVDELDPL